MKRFVFLIILAASSLFSKDLYWDKPVTRLTNAYFFRINCGEDKRLLFSYIKKEKYSYSIYTSFRNPDGLYTESKRVISGIKTDNPKIINPTAAYNRNQIFVTWKGSNNVVYFSKSENSGDIFTAPKMIVQAEDTLLMPYIYYHRGLLFVLYHQKEASSLRVDIKYIISRDSGTTFSQPKTLVSAYSFSFNPFVKFIGNQIHIFWESRPPVSRGQTSVPFEIYYKASYNLGKSFSKAIRITKDRGSNYNPVAYYDGGSFYLVWESNKEGNFAIFLSKINLSDNLLPHQRKIYKISKTATDCKMASIIKLNGLLYIFWKDKRDGVENIYYNTFNPTTSETNTDRNAVFSRSNSVYPTPIIFNHNLSIIYLDRHDDKFSLNERQPDSSTDKIYAFIPGLNKETGYTNNKRVTIKWRPISDVSGVSKIYFLLDKSPKTTPDMIETNELPDSDTSYVKDVSEGTWYFHIFYIDKAGNTSPVTHLKFAVDTIPPSEPIAFLPDENKFADKKNNIIGTPGGIVRWMVGSDAYKYEYAVSMLPKFFDHLVKTTTSSQIRFNIFDNGTYYFHIRAVDKAGNKSITKTLRFQVRLDPKLIQGDVFINRPKERIIISTTVKNMNLSSLPYPEISAGTTFYKTKFFNLPFILTIKYALLFILAFLGIFVLFVLLARKNRTLYKEIDKIKALPGKKIMALPMPKNYNSQHPAAGEVPLLEGMEYRAVPKDAGIVYGNAEDLVLNIDITLDAKEKDVYSKSSRAEVLEAEEIEETEAVQEAEPVSSAYKIDDDVQEAQGIDEAEALEADEYIESAVEEAEPAEAIETSEYIEEASAYQDTVFEKAPEDKIETKEGIFGLRFKYSFLVTLVVIISLVIGTLITSIYTQKSTQKNLSEESIEKIKAVLKSLNYAAITAIETNNDFIILENLGFTKKDKDITDAFIVRWSLDINSGKNKWMMLKRNGESTSYDNSASLTEIKNLVFKKGKNAFKITPKFSPEDLKSEYEIVTPILRLNPTDNLTPELLKNKTKFLGLAGIKFSTKRIFSKVVEARKNLIKINSIIAVSMIIFGIIAAIFFASLMIKPIINLVKGVQIVGKGDFEHKTAITTKDEVGALTKAFNKMTGDLKDAQEAMIKKKLLEEQFSIAEGIQISLIPTDAFSSPAVEVVGYYKSALGVGGDYYDYLKIDEERIGVIICDVAGKGIPASLIMVQIQTIFTTYLNKDSKSAAKLVETVNNNLAETIQPGLFATMLFFIYNQKTGELVFSNAGHGPFEYFSAKENKINKLLTETPPTGIMPGMEYKDTKLALEKGDVVYMYTDGITEAMSISREEFGNERLEKIIKNSRTKSASEINKEIIEAVQEFTIGAEQSDDISLIIMKVK